MEESEKVAGKYDSDESRQDRRKNGLLKKGNPSKKIQRKGQYEHNTTTCLVSIMEPRY